MIKDTAVISIRSIGTEYPTELDGKKQGEVLVKVHYQVLVKTFVGTEQVWTLISDHHIILNGTYLDESCLDALTALTSEVEQAIVDNNEQNTKSLTAE